MSASLTAVLQFVALLPRAAASRPVAQQLRADRAGRRPRGRRPRVLDAAATARSSPLKSFAESRGADAAAGDRERSEAEAAADGSHGPGAYLHCAAGDRADILTSRRSRAAATRRRSRSASRSRSTGCSRRPRPSSRASATPRPAPRRSAARRACRRRRSTSTSPTRRSASSRSSSTRGVARSRSSSTASRGAERDFEERHSAGLRAILEAIEANPAMAQAILVETVGAGPRVAELRDAALDGVRRRSCTSRPCAPPS